MSMIEKSPRQERLDAQQAQASAEAWGQWAADINQRFARLESRFNCWFGSGDAGDFPDGGEPPMVIELVAEMTGVERKERAEAIAKIVDAMNERFSAEVAVLSEQLTARLDSRVFDIASIREFKDKTSKAASDLKRDVKRGLEVASARLDANADRLDKLERSVAGVERHTANLQARIATGTQIEEARIKDLAERIDLAINDLRDLRSFLEEETRAAWPGRLALPSPN